MNRLRSCVWAVFMTAGFLLVQVGLAGLARGDEPAPEIDPGSIVSALTLLCGGVLILTGRRKRS
jgi:hypothetical protein